MELKLNAGDKIQIPDNCNAVIKDGVVVIEGNGMKFKRGDFVVDEDALDNEPWIILLDRVDKDIWHSIACMSGSYFSLNIGNSRFRKPLRFATYSEKQLLLDKLHENGKDWDAEKCEIVDLKYVPKVGDCLKLEWMDATTFIECSGLKNGIYPCGYKTIINNDGIYEHNLTNSGWIGKWKVTKITSEEFKSEFNKLGYEYDFETHTAKKIEWKPKNGDKYWRLDNYCGVFEAIYAESHCNRMWNNGFVFRTCELAEAAWELLKKAKHY